MTIPSSRSLILLISVVSITSPSADFERLRKTSDIFRRLRNSSEIFGNDLQKSQHPRIKISRLYVRKSWQVYYPTIISNWLINIIMLPMYLEWEAFYSFWLVYTVFWACSLLFSICHLPLYK